MFCCIAILEPCSASYLMDAASLCTLAYRTVDRTAALVITYVGNQCGPLLMQVSPTCTDWPPRYIFIIVNLSLYFVIDID